MANVSDALLAVTLFILRQSVRATDVIYGHEDPSLNKFKNWDFESNLSSDDWLVKGSTVTRVNGAYHGKRCIKIENRDGVDSGVSQTVEDLKQDTNYYVSAFVQLLSDNNDGPGYTTFTLTCNVGREKNTVAVLPFQKVEKSWKHIGGDFKVKTGSAANCWIRVEPRTVTYLIDATSFTELKKQSNWTAYFDEKIKKLRTSCLTIKGLLPSGCCPSSTTLKVELKRHEFGFGTAIKAKQFLGTSQVQVNYRNFILKHFNWVVFENAMKWAWMEKTYGNIDYYTIDKIMAILKENNMTVRGHALLWDVMTRNPNWVQNLTGIALTDAAIRRVKYMTKHYRNRIAEWDVCNEFLHRHFLEEKSGYKDVLVAEFKSAHKLDENAKLFLNDYEIVKNGRLTSASSPQLLQLPAIADLAEFLNKKKARCDGIGIQSHLRVVPLDEEVLEKRVQIAGRVGLPVTITEFSVHSNNVQTRADALEMALRVYFADSNVHAVMLWCFADQFYTFANDFYLTEGTDFTPNAAGQRFLHLIHEEWSTKKEIIPRKSKVNITIRDAFRGTYQLTAVCDGEIKLEKEFYLGKAPTVVNF